MDESGNTHNRRSRRSNLLMQATLETPLCAFCVTLRNLSSDGARVEADHLPLEGTDLLFRKGELTVPGRIIWSRGRQAGIQFERKLDAGVVLNHVPAPRARLQFDFRRPGLGARQLTPTERTLGKYWIDVAPIPAVED